MHPQHKHTNSHAHAKHTHTHAHALENDRNTRLAFYAGARAYYGCFFPPLSTCAVSLTPTRRSGSWWSALLPSLARCARTIVGRQNVPPYDFRFTFASLHCERNCTSARLALRLVEMGASRQTMHSERAPTAAMERTLLRFFTGLFRGKGPYHTNSADILGRSVRCVLWVNRSPNRNRDRTRERELIFAAGVRFSVPLRRIPCLEYYNNLQYPLKKGALDSG